VKSTDVVIVADVSGSMRGLQRKQQDAIWALLQQFAREETPDAAGAAHVYNVSILPFGQTIGPGTPFAPASSYAQDNLSNLHCNQGSTRLRDALIAAVAAVQVRNPEAALVQVFTDGGENGSSATIDHCAGTLRAQLARDYLTVALTGPPEAGREAHMWGISADNFRPWDGHSDVSYGQTVQATQSAVSTYTVLRKAGRRSTVRYYADATKLTESGTRGMTKQVVPTEVKSVSKHMDGRAIADFFKKFEKGKHFYQLVKPEYIDEDKELVVHLKDKNEFRQGSRTVRMLLGLPDSGRIRVYPGPHSEKFDIYVQSASVNRKLVEGQKLLTV
jgi:hypothetical protein